MRPGPEEAAAHMRSRGRANAGGGVGHLVNTSVMDDDHSHRARVRRRRENVEGGRGHSHRVRVSPEEEAVLVRLAAEQRVTVPRLLMEAALSADHEKPGQRRRAIADLFATRRLLAEITLGIAALIECGALADVTIAERMIERNDGLAERLDATAGELIQR